MVGCRDDVQHARKLRPGVNTSRRVLWCGQAACKQMSRHQKTSWCQTCKATHLLIFPHSRNMLFLYIVRTQVLCRLINVYIYVCLVLRYLNLNVSFCPSLFSCISIFARCNVCHGVSSLKHQTIFPKTSPLSRCYLHHFCRPLLAAGTPSRIIAP